MTIKRTKIICTLGPSTDSLDTLKSLIRAGMDVARFNFSHGDHETHRRRFELVQEAARQLSVVVATLGDIQGPKIRVGKFAAGAVTLTPGQEFTITTRDVSGDEHVVSTTHPELPRDVKLGDAIYLADALMELKVIEVSQTDVRCEVVEGGILSSNKGLNLPGCAVSAPCLTVKDEEDLVFALEMGFDMLALSFVRSPSDVTHVKRLIYEAGRDVPIVTKIEKPQAVETFDGILEVSDAIMIARGDLGVELPPERVPGVQKMIIHKCNQAGVPVITATQMLESMTENLRPTRAEASDVANAIYDGTDAVMLSGETAAGRHPVRACETMARIAREAERFDFHDSTLPERRTSVQSREEAVSVSSCHAADALGAAAIVTYTISGGTARLVARHRPKCRILALTPRVECARRLQVVWSVTPHVVPEMTTVDELFQKAGQFALRAGVARPGESVVITAGAPLGRPGTTNLMKIQEVEG